MKTLRIGRCKSMLVLLVMALFATCSEPADEDIDPEDKEQGEITPDEADALSDAFSFTSSTKKTGSVPAVDNTSLARMNGSDTIYLVGGVKMPMRISFPVETPVTGTFIYVKNSTFYYDVPVFPEDGSTQIRV